ncbi:unnamed protein product [Closterium sp. Naga37s-1]|nr:unnamed protein product [Closterium sp. Naga37s-1]
MTVNPVCSEVLMEEQTLSIEQSYKHITTDASAFSGDLNTIEATTGVNGKEGKGGREQTHKKKDGKREKKRGPFKGRCYNCNEDGHMTVKCPNKKKDATPAAAANVAEGDGKANEGQQGLPWAAHGQGRNLQTKKGVTHNVASGGQVDATARYCHRLLCFDLKPWPASKGTASSAACNGMAAAAAGNGTVTAMACYDTVAAAACNGTVATTASNGKSKVVADVASRKPAVKK